MLVAAIGETLPAVVAIVSPPLATATTIVPVPGGAGVIASALVALFVTLGGRSAAVVAAAAVLYRLATDAFPPVLGGTILAAFSHHG